MSLQPLEYIRHILQETDFLVHHSEDLTFERFCADPALQRAFVRSLEVIGEAVKKLPNDYTQRYPRIEWRLIAGMRDRLIHGYFAVDYALVWDVVQHRIPGLGAELREILRQT